MIQRREELLHERQIEHRMIAAELPIEQRLDAPEARQRARHREHAQRPDHHSGRFVRVRRGVRARTTEERDVVKAEHVKRRQCRNRHREHEQADAVLDGRGENRVLAEEPAERRHAAQRQRADEKGPVRDGQFFLQSAHVPNVLLVMQRVNHRAGAEEKHRLEERVRREVKHRRRGRVDADREHHVAELRERRVGEDALDVILLHRHQRREQRGESTDPADDFERVRAGDVEDEKHAAQHVNARGHHRRRVDQRAHGRRAFHRIGQPDVQRELRALAHRAAENQQARARRARAERGGIFEQLILQHVEIQRAEQRPHGENPEEKTEVAEAIRDEGFFARVRRRGFFVPETDEQIARDADEFPEDEHLEQVVREDNSQH